VSEGAEPEGVEVPIAWMGPEDVPILFANAFVAQFDQTLDAFILTIGQMTPPALIGASPEELRAQAEQITFVPVKPVARFALSPGRMRELVAVLHANLDQQERAATMRPKDPR
jgi:predicted GNAT superfamily acetyltransferase